MTKVIQSAALLLVLLAGCGGKPKTESRYPARPEGCDVKMFHGKIAGIRYDDIGRVDALCGTDIPVSECLKELRNQTCKLGATWSTTCPTSRSSRHPTKIPSSVAWHTPAPRSASSSRGGATPSTSRTRRHWVPPSRTRARCGSPLWGSSRTIGRAMPSRG